MPHKKTARDVEMQQYDASTKNRAPDFAGWDFTRADLANADFYKADLSHMNFTGANLTGADFRDADLTGAKMTEAKLHEAILASATYDPAQFLNARGINPYSPHHCASTHRFDTILPTDPDTQELLRELLQDWEGTLGEAITAAEELRRARPRAARPCPCWTVQHPRTGSRPTGTLGAPTEKEDPDAP